MRTNTYLTTIALAVMAVTVTACSSATTGLPQSTAASNSSASTSAPVTPRISVTQPSATPATSTAPKMSPSTADGGATTSSEFTMPNEVGKVLQDAQDDIQRVSGNPVYFTRSTDASGQDRFQILDSNWQVCSQNVAPGQPADATTVISFAAVKLDESCP
jgi:hypothetical protein